MEKAYVGAIGDALSNGVSVGARISVLFLDASLPGGYSKTSLSVNITSVSSPSTMQTAISNAVQAEASKQGLSVPAGSTILWDGTTL